jgi:Zn-dependent peptidase ImmA (M78 family)
VQMGDDMAVDTPLIEIDDEAGQSFARRIDAVLTLEEVKQKDLAEFAQVTDRTIRGWTSGVIPFRSNLRSIEGYTGFSSAFFLAGHPACTVDGLNFWARVSAPKYVRGRFAAFAVVVGEVVAQLLLETSLPEPVLSDVLPSTRGIRPASAAVTVRSAYELTERAVDPLVFAESIGVLITFGPPEIFNVDAYSAWIDGRPLIVLNPSRTDPVRIWHAVAHELGHLFMHGRFEDDSPKTRDDREREAEEFAQEFLVPNSSRVNAELQRAVRTRPWEALSRFGNIFRVSVPELLAIATNRDLERSGYLAERAVKYNVEGIAIARAGTAAPFRGPETLQRALEDVSEAHGYGLDEFAVEVGIPSKLVGLLRSTSVTQAASADRVSQVSRLVKPLAL